MLLPVALLLGAVTEQVWSLRTALAYSYGPRSSHGALARRSSTRQLRTSDFA